MFDLDDKDAVLFYLLPYLIEVSKKRKRNVENQAPEKQSTKSSIQERRNSLLLHVQVFQHKLFLKAVVRVIIKHWKKF